MSKILLKRVLYYKCITIVIMIFFAAFILRKHFIFVLLYIIPFLLLRLQEFEKYKSWHLIIMHTTLAVFVGFLACDVRIAVILAFFYALWAFISECWLRLVMKDIPTIIYGNCTSWVKRLRYAPVGEVTSQEELIELIETTHAPILLCDRVPGPEMLIAADLWGCIVQIVDVDKVPMFFTPLNKYPGLYIRYPDFAE